MQLPTILLCTISYLLFFFFLLVAKKINANRITTGKGRLVAAPLLLWLHLAGVLLFGMLPFCFSFVPRPLFTSTESGLQMPTMVSLALFLLTLWCGPRLGEKQIAKFSSGEPVIAPSFIYLGSYFFLRTLFIVSYEIWFRGFLLQGTLLILPLYGAVVLNVVLYTLLHLVNGKTECMLCIPFGILLCILCVWQQTPWPAVFIHLALTLGYELALVKNRITKTILYAHPRHRRIGLHRS
ncbi:MAG TPA: CPBP family intramembrane glutamic endopeptidase [Flavisolibacter sp.]|nr:CPBP family intramembrane glutamic endopeptidase [Flavisolibacter sp.]